MFSPLSFYDISITALTRRFPPKLVDRFTIAKDMQSHEGVKSNRIPNYKYGLSLFFACSAGEEAV